MLKRNSGITDTKPKPDDTADKVQKYTYCFAYAVRVITHRLRQMTKYYGE